MTDRKHDSTASGDEDLLDLLPGELRAIAEIIGIPAALRLVEARGGRRIYFPAGVDADHQLVKLIGQAPAEALCQAYAGERLEIPRALGYVRAVRNAHIMQSRAQGISQSALAGEHQLSERHIRNIERCAGDDGQMGLF
ncbi:Mor transcription activator family protein [Rhodocyclus tenuis]|uniref:Mor family transcriptional regulator n=1 Tax=Rhodocyclus tenuis TaxID=1066 RepID=A0A840G8N0_RHOTE|nr:Mor transcription activator family protein [Rhodocyclus tenuis]MBB4247270.1 Mor family transcriptional regulator [Rhodocyclus tenuis]